MIIFTAGKFTVSPVVGLSASRCGAATWMIFSDDGLWPTAMKLCRQTVVAPGRRRWRHVSAGLKPATNDGRYSCSAPPAPTGAPAGNRSGSCTQNFYQHQATRKQALTPRRLLFIVDYGSSENSLLSCGRQMVAQIVLLQFTISA